MSRWVDANPRDNLEKMGLESISDEDCAGSYEFNIFFVFRHVESGRIFWGRDSGCSCPHPFENMDFHGPDKHDYRELTQANWKEFQKDLEAWDGSIADRTKVRQAAATALRPSHATDGEYTLVEGGQSES